MVENRYGSDPEAGLLELDPNGNVVRCLRADSVVNRHGSSVFGLDGAPTTLEYRPKPGNTPQEFLKEVGRAIKVSKMMLGKATQQHQGSQLPRGHTYGIGAGARIGDWAIGGHIHIQSDRITSDVSKRTRLVQGLDFCLSIPMMLIQNPTSARYRREHLGYGKIDGSRTWETSPWATGSLTGHGIEYRVPESWVISPEYTLSAVSIASVVTEAVQAGWKPPAFMSWDTHLYQQFHTCSKSMFAPMMAKIYTEIKKMPSFSENQTAIKFLYAKAGEQKVWEEGENILEMWDARLVDVGAVEDLMTQQIATRNTFVQSARQDGFNSSLRGDLRGEAPAPRNRIVNPNTFTRAVRGDIMHPLIPPVIEGMMTRRGLYVYTTSHQVKISAARSRGALEAQRFAMDAVQNFARGLTGELRPGGIVETVPPLGAKKAQALGIPGPILRQPSSARNLIREVVMAINQVR